MSPLRRRIESAEALEHLFHRYGWTTALDEAAFERFRAVSDLPGSLTAFLDAADGEPDGLALARAAEPLLQALAELGATSVTGLPEPLDRGEFWESIGAHLPDDLLEEYLRIHQPGVFLVLRLARVIRYEPSRPEGAFRRPYTRITVDSEQALAMVRDPLSALQRAYRWGDPDPSRPFEHQAALEALASALEAIRLPARPVLPALLREPPLPAAPTGRIQDDARGLRTIVLRSASDADQTLYKAGFEVYPAVAEGETRPSGLMVKPVLQGGTGQSVPLGDFALRWSVAADLSDTIGFALFPGGADIVGGDAAVGTRLEIASARDEPWYLLGGPGTARVEVTGFSAGLTLEGSAADPEIRFRLLAEGKDGRAGGRVVIPLEGSDAFVSDTVKRSTIELEVPLDVVWSSRTGLSFNGRPNLDVDLPVRAELGPITVLGANLAVTEGPAANGAPSLACRVAAGLRGRLGPVAVVVERVGFELTVARRDRAVAAPGGDAARPVATFGDLDVGFGFKPPDGVGLAVEAGPVSGGGFLRFDPERGEYAGAVELEVAGVAVKAVGLLTTRLPGGAPGFSLLILISAEFAPISLGLGFTLNGVGGLIAVNRTAAVAALRAGLKTGALGAVLSPPDPIANAPQVIAALSGLFPTASGRHVIGPVARIGWGSPTLITIDVAVLLELPAPVRLVILGRLRAVLPDEQAALVVLQMDLLGVIDVDRREAAVDATLVDSRLASFALTGDMAMRLAWGPQPSFLLAVGGFNPRFAPPPGFPALDRVSVALAKGGNPRLRLEAYLAVTSNTVQLGARVDLSARAGKFEVAGFLSFDALVVLRPLSFVVDLAAKLAVRVGGRTLLSVSLTLTLSGPEPWRARGKASFSILFFDVSFRFDVTIGDEPPPALPRGVDVAPLLRAALADPRAWEAQLPAGPLVTLRAPAAGTAVRAHPLGTLAVRQRVVPLGREIERFGEDVPAGARRFAVTGAFVGTRQAATEVLEDLFAPGQFRDLTDEQKLSSPSFEPMPSGARIGTTDVEHGAPVVVEVHPEQRVVRA